MLDNVTTTDKIGGVLGLLGIIKRTDEAHCPPLSSVWADVAGIESNTSVSPLLAKQAEEFTLSATHLNNQPILKAVFR
jgi:hypothetical protein